MKAPPQMSRTPFSERLKRETREVHTMAEKCAFMQGFLRGTASRETYVDYLEGMRRIYVALEAGLRANAGHPAVGTFCEPVVFRESAIRRDLEYFGGQPLSHSPNAVKALEGYTTHLARLTEYWPEGLIAHAYTRYMGDVSGGRVLARIVSKSLGLVEGDTAGLAFYHFGELESIERFKRAFREKLDALEDREPELPAKLTEETIRAFRLNLSFFEAMEGRAWVSALRQIFPRRAPGTDRRPARPHTN